MMKSIRASFLVALALLLSIVAVSMNVHSAENMVPNNLKFWDNSENWTTDYGPAYRDTVEKIGENINFVTCTGQFALCFTSGPEPLPCEITKEGRFANCTCTAQNGLNFVLISAILNFEVWQDTVNQCRADGSLCKTPDTAPVCAAIKSGELIKGADLISTFDVNAQSAIAESLETDTLLVCPKSPYAACMTAPCRQKKGENPVCSCPVFDGVFQLPTPGATCDPGEGLIPSASFTPKILNR